MRTRGFTGRHMLATMLAFFGTIIAVNMTMATLATRSFGGTVVDNSYVATRNYNRWLEEAREQEALGWRSAVALDAERRITVTLHQDEAALAGARLTAVARHPVGRADDVAIAFAEIAPGRFRSLGPLPAGRWQLHLSIRRGGDEMRAIEELS